MKISEPNYRNFSEEQNLMNKIQSSRSQMYESLDKIHVLERSIKKIDFNYEIQYKYNRIGRYLPK